MGTCFYKILGVPVGAGYNEIKKAFRLLALRWHPDRNPQDPAAAEAFREALEAYETLVNPVKRRRYDRVRGYGRPGRTSEPGWRRGSGNGERVSPSTLEEVFEEAFGFQRPERSEARETDLRFDLQVLRSASVTGTYEQVDYERLIYCGDCWRNGKAAHRASCGICHGSGEVGEMCSIRVWIPPSVEHGARLRMRGAGDRRSPGIPAGDLVILLWIID